MEVARAIKKGCRRRVVFVFGLGRPIAGNGCGVAAVALGVAGPAPGIEPP